MQTWCIKKLAVIHEVDLLLNKYAFLFSQATTKSLFVVTSDNLLLRLILVLALI